MYVQTRACVYDFIIFVLIYTNSCICIFILYLYKTIISNHDNKLHITMLNAVIINHATIYFYPLQSNSSLGIIRGSYQQLSNSVQLIFIKQLSITVPIFLMGSTEFTKSHPYKLTDR